MKIGQIVSEVRYKRESLRRKRAQLQREQAQKEKALRSSIITTSINGVEISDNLSLIELFGKLKNVEATSRNKPATDKLTGGLRLVFHPSKRGGSRKEFTFSGDIKVTRDRRQPPKFTLLGLGEDGLHELWLTVTCIRKYYVWTYASHSGSISAGFADDRQDVTLLGRSADGKRHIRVRRGQP